MARPRARGAAATRTSWRSSAPRPSRQIPSMMISPRVRGDSGTTPQGGGAPSESASVCVRACSRKPPSAGESAPGDAPNERHAIVPARAPGQSGRASIVKGASKPTGSAGATSATRATHVERSRPTRGRHRDGEQRENDAAGAPHGAASSRQVPKRHAPPGQSSSSQQDGAGRAGTQRADAQTAPSTHGRARSHATPRPPSAPRSQRRRGAAPFSARHRQPAPSPSGKSGEKSTHRRAPSSSFSAGPRLRRACVAARAADPGRIGGRRSDARGARPRPRQTSAPAVSTQVHSPSSGRRGVRLRAPRPVARKGGDVGAPIDAQARQPRPRAPPPHAGRRPRRRHGARDERRRTRVAPARPQTAHVGARQGRLARGHGDRCAEAWRRRGTRRRTTREGERQREDGARRNQRARPPGHVRALSPLARGAANRRRP